MGEADLGLTEAVAIALGGMIGGGIYAVMGVVAKITTTATWAAFVLAGVVALAAGYSFDVLNRLSEDRGGSVTFVQCFTGNTTLAGTTGWTLLFGYVGSMAMYAFAFGEFTVAFAAVPDAAGPLPMRPLVSVVAVVGFVGLNVVGARATGVVENALVGGKVAILVAFGLLGLVYAAGPSGPALRFGIGKLTSSGPLVAAAISFVAFQGWQLLYYDQDAIADPARTIRRAVFVAIPVAVVVYVLVGVVTVNLVPAALQTHPHVALRDAARLMMQPYGLATAGGVVLSLSALLSTGSAINATLFSAAHFATGMVSDDLLPDRIEPDTAESVPDRIVYVLGAITAALTGVGGLGAITSFASLAFILVFGGTCLLAFAQRDQAAVHPLPPLVGTVGAAAFFPLMLWNLLVREPRTFYAVLLLGGAVVAVELLYFERDVLAEEVEPFDPPVPGVEVEADN